MASYNKIPAWVFQIWYYGINDGGIGAVSSINVFNITDLSINIMGIIMAEKVMI